MAGSACGGAAVYTDARPRDSLTVGDPIHLTVGIVVPSGAHVVPPPTEEGLGNLVVREWTFDKEERADADSLTFSFLLATYVPEPCTIPSVPFLVVIGDSVDTLRSEPIPLRLISVIPSDTVDIKDLKPQQSAGRPSLLWLWILLAVLLVTAAVVLGIHWYDRHRKPRPPPPPKPPYEEALEALRLLDARDLLRQGLVKEYVFELSEILKRYTERRFGCNAIEFTTDELLQWLRSCELERTVKRHAERFFADTDPVKFAKWLPDDETLGRFRQDVRSFVEATRPGAEQPEPAAPREGEEKQRGA